MRAGLDHEAACDASQEVQEYIADVIYPMAEALDRHVVAPASGQVTLKVYISETGVVTQGVVTRSTSSQATAAAKALLDDPPRLPPPPRTSRSCLVDTQLHLTLIIDKVLDCEVEYVEGFYEGIHGSITDELYRQRPRTGYGRVLLTLYLAGDGSVTEFVTEEAANPDARERVEAAVRKLGSFEAPKDEYAHCLVDSPILLWLVVPGS
ncbi:MAG TPA: hypothetical protein VIY27_14650 [Myxococcota bacterium]